MRRLRHLPVPFTLLVLACPVPAGSGAQDLAIQDPLAKAMAEIAPRSDEERWRLIPWSTSLTDTLEQARESGRPVFLFGYDGVLDTGNC